MIGTIRGFRGSWSSGLGALLVETDDGDGLEVIYCENGPTVRALNNCFGDVIAPGHTVNQEAIEGQEIEFEVDDSFGLLLWFRPTDFPIYDPYE